MTVRVTDQKSFRKPKLLLRFSDYAPGDIFFVCRQHDLGGLVRACGNGNRVAVNEIGGALIF